MDGSIDSDNISVIGYHALIRRNSITNMHGLAVYVKEGLPVARGLSLENSTDSYICFQLAFTQCLLSFFSHLICFSSFLSSLLLKGF